MSETKEHRRNTRLRKPLLLLTAFMPQGVKIAIYRHLLHWKIGKNIKIGFSFIEGDFVEIGDNARIGHFNIIRGLRHLQIGSGGYLANFNEIFGANFYDWPISSMLIIGDHVNLMSHHFLDVGGIITIGNNVTVGGRDTHFWSHSVYLENGVRVMKPIQIIIGNDVYIGARATLVGCAIPDGAFIGAGSIVTKDFPAEDSRLLIAGNPAAIKKRYPPSS